LFSLLYFFIAIKKQANMVVKRTSKQDKVFQGISVSCAHFKNGTGVIENLVYAVFHRNWVMKNSLISVAQVVRYSV
jgi:hypothetical protein